MNIKSLKGVLALLLAFQSLVGFAQGTELQADSAAVSGNRHMVFISGGGSIIESKVYDQLSAASNKIGFDYMAGYDWIISKSGLGVGILYNGFFSSRKVHMQTGYGYGEITPHTTIFINTIAPQFVVDIVRPASRWAFSFKAGIGLSGVTEALKLHGELTERHTKYGIGVTLMAGAEYRITRHIGITAGLAAISSYFGTFYDEESGFDRIDGINRISLDFGLKYRF